MALFAKETSPTSAAPSPRASSQGQLGGTLIGPNIVIEGTISGSETTVVEGTVRGEITLTGGFNFCLPLLRYRTGDYGSLAMTTEGLVIQGLEGRRP